MNNHPVKSVREQDEHLQEIIQFKKIDKKNTLIISSMIGWGNGVDWHKTYDLFVKSNEYTYGELIKNFKKEQVTLLKTTDFQNNERKVYCSGRTLRS